MICFRKISRFCLLLLQKYFVYQHDPGLETCQHRSSFLRGISSPHSLFACQVPVPRASCTPPQPLLHPLCLLYQDLSPPCGCFSLALPSASLTFFYSRSFWCCTNLQIYPPNTPDIASVAPTTCLLPPFLHPYTVQITHQLIMSSPRLGNLMSIFLAAILSCRTKWALGNNVCNACMSGLDCFPSGHGRRERNGEIRIDWPFHSFAA